MALFSFFLNTQVRSLFLWISSVALPEDVIAVVGKRTAYYRFSFPLRSGEIPERVENAKEQEITFRIFLDGVKAPLDGALWVALFETDNCSLYEKSSRCSEEPPLRYGLREEEKKALGAYVYATLQKVLVGDRAVSKEPFPFRRIERTKATVGVALWVEGELRGSQVVSGDSVLEGARRAALACLFDIRFKPLSIREVASVSIEITVLSSLEVPLTKKELHSVDIEYDKAYCVKNGERRAWFLPEVHNVRRYSDQRVFLHDLIAEKAEGISRKGSSLCVCMVEDFVYSAQRETTVTTLFATMPAQKLLSVVSLKEQLVAAATESAEALVRIQDKEGNIPPIVRFDGGSARQVDWPRLAFTTYALAAFGVAAEKEVYRVVAKRSLDFIVEHLGAEGVNFPYATLLFSYCGLAALALKEGALADHMTNKILSLAKNKGGDTLDPISCAHMISFFEELPIQEERKVALCQSAEVYLRKAYAKARRSPTFNFAEWAEVVAVFKTKDPAVAKDFIHTALLFQNADGSFASSYKSTTSYTRGSAKIFEVLALDSREVQNSFDAVAQYLLSMHYTGEEWFLAPERRRILQGLFRHDYGNADAWIDSSGHFLLGVARYLKIQHV